MTRYRVLEVPIEKNRVREVRIGSNVVRGALGPADFPECVRIGLDEGNPPTLSIEFVYAMLPEEETQRTQIEKDGTVYLGKHTGRVFRIEAKAPAGTTRGVVRLDVNPAMHQLEESARREAPGRLPRRLAHYSMISELMPWVLKHTSEANAENGTAWAY